MTLRKWGRLVFFAAAAGAMIYCVCFWLFLKDYKTIHYTYTFDRIYMFVALPVVAAGVSAAVCSVWKRRNAAAESDERPTLRATAPLLLGALLLLGLFDWLGGSVVLSGLSLYAGALGADAFGARGA